MKIFGSWKNTPKNEMEVWNPLFSDMTIPEIKNSINFKKRWKTHGYSDYGFCPCTNTVYLIK